MQFAPINPTSAQIKKSRMDAGFTAKECAKLLYITERNWHYYEAGTRKMPPALWELFKIKTQIK